MGENWNEAQPQFPLNSLGANRLIISLTCNIQAKNKRKFRNGGLWVTGWVLI